METNVIMAKVINIFAIVTLVEMMIYIGLGASVSDVVNTVKDWRLVALGMVILLVGSVAVGWLAGGPGGETRKAMALTTAVRNNGVGMVIATGSFAGTDAVTATAIYGMIGLLGALGFAVWWSRDRKILAQ